MIISRFSQKMPNLLNLPFASNRLVHSSFITFQRYASLHELPLIPLSFSKPLRGNAQQENAFVAYYKAMSCACSLFFTFIPARQILPQVKTQVGTTANHFVIFHSVIHLLVSKLFNHAAFITNISICISETG